MTQQRETHIEQAANEAIDRLRQKHALKHLERAKENLRPGSATGFLVRVALAVVYMYLIVISYMMLGVPGPVIVSVLFLAAVLVPHFYRFFASPSQKRRPKTNQTEVVEDTP